MEFLMLSRPDMIEHVDVKITQSETTGTVRQFFKVEGTIRDFKLHPSNQYVVILTDDGFYYIFNLAHGDIRGKQKVDASATKLQLDPSGLYLSIVVGKSKVQIYELAKGNLISEIDPDLFQVSLHQFSGTGAEYLIVDSDKNIVRFYQLDQKITSLI